MIRLLIFGSAIPAKAKGEKIINAIRMIKRVTNSIAAARNTKDVISIINEPRSIVVIIAPSLSVCTAPACAKPLNDPGVVTEE